jgi:hypothetical protein
MLLGRLGCIAAFTRNKREALITRQCACPWRVFATMRGAAIMAAVAHGCLLRRAAGEEV